MVSEKSRASIQVSKEVLTEFRQVASTRTFKSNWFSLGVEEAMVDYIKKYGDKNGPSIQ